MSLQTRARKCGRFFHEQEYQARSKAGVIVLNLILLLSSTHNIIGQVTYEEAFASLSQNRDRILTEYAHSHGYTDAYSLWQTMSASQKGVFLTITDLLGRRTYMARDTITHAYEYIGDDDDYGFGCAQMNEVTDCDDGCYVHPLNYYGPACFYVTGQSCYEMGKCTDNPTLDPRVNFDVALSHVDKFYVIRGGSGSGCGGSDWNRIFFEADDQLMYAFRNLGPFYLPIWGNSSDLSGPHSPFTQSRETGPGKPRGQTHEFAWDYEATSIFRAGLSGYYGPNIVEIDIDYNFWHDSNPECSYDGVYGRYKYQNLWYTYGLGGSAEFGYSPAP
jgi:hypothetical protein